MKFNTIIIIPIFTSEGERPRISTRSLKYTDGKTQGTLLVSEENVELGFDGIYASLYSYATNTLATVPEEIRTIIFTPTTVTIRIKPDPISESTLRSKNSQLVKIPFDIISDTFGEEVNNFVNDIQREISR